MAINSWWIDDPSERYWVEITDRPDLGENLFIPQMTTAGGSTPGYELINFIRPGDVVFHWHKGLGGGPTLVAWSVATGEVEDAFIGWQPHSAHGRTAESAPPRPAWLMPLVDYTPLDPAITYAHVKALEAKIRPVAAGLKAGIDGPLYFPFVFSENRPIRTAQSYLAKFPRALADVLGIAESGRKLALDAGSTIAPIMVRSEGQGYVSDSRVKRAIERRAVELATYWYESRSYAVEYTGGNKPFDLVATRGSEVRRVEVKGTSGWGETVELTHREVDNALDFTPVDLFLVYGIEFERLSDGNAQGFGGFIKLWPDWTPDEGSLQATRYRHTVPSDGFDEFDADR